MDQFEEFLDGVPHLGSASNGKLVQLFGYYLTEIAGESSIRPQQLRECFERARLRAPGNISDVMGKSNAFLKTAAGWHLQRMVKLEIRESLQGFINSEGAVQPNLRKEENSRAGSKQRNVVVIHGRNRALRDSMFTFLRSLGLNPLEWEQAAKATGKGSPYSGEIVEALFNLAQAAVVMITPDERVELRRDLCSSDEEFRREQGWQPRPNVFVEAGMALARDEARTIIVEIGHTRTASDLLGRHSVRLDNSAASHKRLAQRLETAGCSVDTSGEDWLSAGSFSVPVGSRAKSGGNK